MIRYDSSSHSVVAWCTCGWRELTITREGARRVARMHEASQHPDVFQVRHAEQVRRNRNRTPGPPPECDGAGDTIG